MPTYEYACKQCGEHLEVVQKFTDDPLTTCPACSGALRKVFGNIGISFKGSGFYKTDSRTSQNGAKKDKDKEPAGGDSSKAGGSDGDSKPKADTKGDTKGDSKAATKNPDKGTSTAAAS